LKVFNFIIDWIHPMHDLNKIKCLIYRGGTSRGLFFHSADIPQDSEKKKQTFLGLMGSPDIRQIDGLGGATSHTSKVVIISKSEEGSNNSSSINKN